MTVVNFTKKQNVLTGGSVIFGEGKSTDSRSMGVWTDGRTHGHNFEKCVFQNPLPETKSKKKTGYERTLAPSALLARSQFLLCFRKLPPDWWVENDAQRRKLGKRMRIATGGKFG